MSSICNSLSEMLEVKPPETVSERLMSKSSDAAFQCPPVRIASSGVMRLGEVSHIAANEMDVADGTGRSALIGEFAWQP
jgi:hypothetical protein